MIRLLFIVPYPELQSKIEAILQNHPAKSFVQPTIISEMAEHIDRLNYDCDAIVARGYTANKLTNLLPNIPVIELPITSYDILRSVRECLSLYRPDRIAIIGSYKEPHDAVLLSEILRCDIRIYRPPSVVEIDYYVQRSIADGCEVIIGGDSVRQCAISHSAKTVVIRSGDEAVSSALNEVVRIVEAINLEKERAQMYETITQCSREGILYVDSNQIVQVINKAALQMHQGGRSFQRGCSLGELYPFMSHRVREVLQSGREISNELQHYGDTTLSMNYIPIIVSQNVTGVVITFQDITKIQRLESQVRLKLNKKGLHAKYCFDDIVHNSPTLDRTLQIAQHYSNVSSNVLIIGETGTGKELFAQSIHNASKRKAGPFVAINCAALNESLLESELFGYVEGAFTGASKGGKIGLFELAHNGTLFLDEISEIPLNLQGKLLRVLQEREVRRVGGTTVTVVDVRIIAATNRDLTKMVEEGHFRRDLLYRLDVLNLRIPPLRQRKEDISALFQQFISVNNQKFGYQITGISPEASAVLASYNFLGNVRELENIAERISVLKTSGIIQKEDVAEALFHDIPYPTVPSTPMSGRPETWLSEKKQILSALEHSGGNQSKAALLLGINRSTLWRKLKKYQIVLDRR